MRNGGYYKMPPEYAAVIDAPGCQAVPVKFLGCTDEVYVDTVDGTSTANPTVTVTIKNDEFLNNRPGRCEADWLHDIMFEIWTGQLLADAALVAQGTVRLLIDSYDYPLIDDDLFQNYWFCPACLPVEQPTTNIRILGGKAYGDPPGFCPDVFLSDETRLTLTVTFPTGFAATFTLVSKLAKWRYTTTPPLDCVLRPGAYFPATATVVPVVSNCARTLEPVVTAGNGQPASVPVGASAGMVDAAAQGLVIPKGQGIQSGGIEQGPFRT